MTPGASARSDVRKLEALHRLLVECSACPRLVRWREEVARTKVRRFADQEYWGRPVPGFGDPRARLVLVGLAPAAHGGNRTGRMFTGDASGTWLFRALHAAGFANQPDSVSRDDCLRLTDCYIVAALRCAPPGNAPLTAEMVMCRRWLLDELRLLPNVRVVVGLGKIGFDAAVRAIKELQGISGRSLPRFAHGAVAEVGDLVVIASYHPSQQNTFTGKLTRPMLDEVFRTARRHLLL